jgi:4-alpha-glucanotransferase
MPFIAEDLGSLDQPVYDLLDKFDFPGMKVLQFAFGDDNRENPYLPYNHVPNSIVYSGTHDNNTTLGWFRNSGKEVKDHLNDYLGYNVTEKNVVPVFRRLALKSVSKVAVITMQDIVGMGEEALMNIPGSTEGNWIWRVRAEEIPWEEVDHLRHLNHLYGRT